MGAVRHIECANCGGEVGFAEFERVITCSYCETRMLADNPDWVGEYRIEKRVDEVAARRALQRFLMEPEMPRGLMRLMRFKDAELCYAPYNDVRLRRLGMMEFAVEKSVWHSSDSDDSPGFGGGLMFGMSLSAEQGRPSSERSVKLASRETTVVIGDIHRVEPAIDRDDLGMEFTAAAMLLKESKAELLPFSREATAREGRIFHPTVLPGSIVAQMQVTGPIDTRRDQTEFVEVRTRRVYYPLWRLRYTLTGREYTATVDAVSGELLTARAPEKDRTRILALLGVVAVFGFFAGRGLHDFLEDLRHPVILSTRGTSIAMADFWIIPLLILILAVFLVVIGGWSRFRYRAEVVKRGPTKKVEKLGDSFVSIRKLFEGISEIDGTKIDVGKYTR